MSSGVNYKKLLEWECRPTPRLPKVLQWLSNKNNDFSNKPHDLLWVALLILSAKVVRNNLVLQYYWIAAEGEQAAKDWDACTM